MNRDMIIKLGEITEDLLTINEKLQDLLDSELEAIESFDDGETKDDLMASAERIRQAIELSWEIRNQLEEAIV